MKDEVAQKDSEEGSLITYKEFRNAINGKRIGDTAEEKTKLKEKSNNIEKLYSNILPRTLSFKEVLQQRKAEPVYKMTDTHADNFAMFRYELNSIFRGHQFLDEDRSDPLQMARFMGRHPLSKT